MLVPLEPPVAPPLWHSGMLFSKQVSLAEQVDMFAHACAAEAIWDSFVQLDIELENAEQFAQSATVAIPALALLHFAQYWLQVAVRLVPEELELPHPPAATPRTNRLPAIKDRVFVEIRIDRSWFSVGRASTVSQKLLNRENDSEADYLRIHANYCGFSGT